MFNVCHTRGQASIITIKRGKVESPLPANKKIVPYSGKFSRGPIFAVKLNCTAHNGRECVRPQKFKPVQVVKINHP